MEKRSGDRGRLGVEAIFSMISKRSGWESMYEKMVYVWSRSEFARNNVDCRGCQMDLEALPTELPSLEGLLDLSERMERGWQTWAVHRDDRLFEELQVGL